MLTLELTEHETIQIGNVLISPSKYDRRKIRIHAPKEISITRIKMTMEDCLDHPEKIEQMKVKNKCSH